MMTVKYSLPSSFASSISSSDLNHFLYLPKTELDMLYGEIVRPDGAKRTIKWKLDAKLASVSVKKETLRAVDDEQSNRLKELIAALESSGQVGTVDEPSSYFKGTLPMKWGMLRDFGRPQEEPPLVYFGGRTRKTIFGLGGSTRHVLGFDGAGATSSRSAAPYLV